MHVAGVTTVSTGSGREGREKERRLCFMKCKAQQLLLVYATAGRETSIRVHLSPGSSCGLLACASARRCYSIFVDNRMYEQLEETA